MAVTPQDIQAWCGTLLAGRAANPDLSLADYLDAIPGLDSIDDVPSGTPVLVRGDVDAKPGAKIGEGDIRLRSMVDTLQVRPGARLEADHLRPHRPQAGGLAGEGGEAAG